MHPSLSHLKEIKATLKDYKISATSQKVLAKTKLALLVGPSSSGRNTIIKELIKGRGFHYIVSDTTRTPRTNNGVMEKNGVEYWFRTEEDVLNDLINGNFLEAALIHNQQVSGISIRELSKATKNNEIAVADIEVVGYKNIKEAKPDAYGFFVAPPSFQVWMERMDGRGKMLDAEKRRRLISAIDEYAEALQDDRYILVINDTFIHSVEYIEECVSTNKIDHERQTIAREVIEDLIIATKNYLNL